MKCKDISLRIKRYACIEGLHWYVFGSRVCKNPPPVMKFNRYEDARKYALKHAYAKNIETIE